MGKNLAFFIDSLLLEGKYYTPYRFAGNLTPKNEEPGNIQYLKNSVSTSF